MSGWRHTTLGELCDSGGGEIRTGPFGSQLHEADYSLEGTPVIMPKDIALGRVDEGSIARVSPRHVERLSQHKLAIGDIVYGRRGDIGRKALITEREAGWLCGTGCLRVTVGNKADPRFLFYRLGVPDTVSAIRNRAIGATMPNLNTTILREVELTLPSLETQRRIASILGAYDDLIEVNRRRVAVLEEMARGLFEEWFVRFRFPGHEAVAIVDTPDGQLPEGWKISELADLCAGKDGVQTGPFGSQLHQEDYSDEGVPVLMPKNLLGLRIVTDGIARIPQETAENLSRHIVREGDIVYGRRGDIGRRAYIAGRQDGWFCGTGCLRLRPDRSRVSPRYLFAALGTAETDGAIKARATGATMPNLSAGVMKAVPVLEPTLAIQQAFSAYAGPVDNLVDGLVASNAALSASRDLLLPRLISGRVSVETAERELEDAA